MLHLLKPGQPVFLYADLDMFVWVSVGSDFPLQCPSRWEG